jgi:putative membrane protein
MQRGPLRASTLFFLCWVAAMTVYCLVRLNAIVEWFLPATAATIAFWLASAIAAALETHRVARTVAMLMSGFGIALLFEYLGSAHGLIFGDYDYTDLLGPRAFGHVPILIPAAWFMMLYPSWEVAGRLAPRSPALRIVYAAAAMTAWDLSLDPRMVADGAWIWPNGGFYFGIPLSNFVGWFVTAAAIFLVWSRLTPSTAANNDMPLAIYVTAWLGESGANVMFWSGPVVGVVVFVAMGAFAVPALLRRSQTSRTAAGSAAGALLDRIRPLARLADLEAGQAPVDMTQHQVRAASATAVERRSQVHPGDLT